MAALGAILGFLHLISLWRVDFLREGVNKKKLSLITFSTSLRCTLLECVMEVGDSTHGEMSTLLPNPDAFSAVNFMGPAGPSIFQRLSCMWDHLVKCTHVEY